jgi:uncharacterized protein (DUF924 family)
VHRSEDVLRYWFGEADRDPLTLEALKTRIPLWFGESAATDEHVRANFMEDIEAAAAGRLDAWAETPRGRLALIVVCDQFPRNAFRGTPRAFALDAKALALTDEGLAANAHEGFNAAHRIAFYLPIMHAEDRGRQKQALDLYRRLQDSSPVKLHPVLSLVNEAAQRHARIVERFGRYPHRNAVLGRPSTAEEQEFMAGPDSSYQPDKK